MIVKRLEKNGKIKAMFASSTVAASTYDITSGDLTVIFNNGGTYLYPSVAKTDYTRFELAESTGSEFNIYIKKKYPNFTKLDPMPSDKMAALLAEIKQLYEDATPKINDKEVLVAMLDIFSSYVEDGGLNMTKLSKLVKIASQYESQNKSQLVG